MKTSLIGLAVALCSTGVYAYSDAAIAGAEGLSVFDKRFESRKQNTNLGVVEYQRSEFTPAAVLDLSLDEPVIVVEETETEKRYREVLAELEQNRMKLDLARADAERVIESAHAEVVQKADERVRLLESQRNSIERQLADIKAQEQRISEALEMNVAAMANVQLMEEEGAMQVAMIQQQSQQILMMAESSAVAIESAAKNRVALERIDPTVVLNEPVEAEFESATIEEISRGLMPEGWRVTVEFNNRPELAERRYQFISTDPRDLALRKLTTSVRDAKLRFAYFWDLKDAQGNPAPLLLITDRSK